MLARLERLADIRLIRYVLASVGALAIDTGSFLVLMSLGLLPVLASAAGYCIGIAIHWLLSSRAVFADSVAERGAGRLRQKTLFVGSALVGLALTTLIVGWVDMGGGDPRIGKAVAIVVSFAATWLLREKIVFRPRAA